MAVVKTQRKISGRPRKVAAKKAKPQPGSLAAIKEFKRLVDKYKLDFSYIKE